MAEGLARWAQLWVVELPSHSGARDSVLTSRTWNNSIMFSPFKYHIIYIYMCVCIKFLDLHISPRNVPHLRTVEIFSIHHATSEIMFLMCVNVTPYSIAKIRKYLISTYCWMVNECHQNIMVGLVQPCTVWHSQGTQNSPTTKVSNHAVRASLNDQNTITGLILGLRLANERCLYKVTPSLNGWVHT